MGSIVLERILLSWAGYVLRATLWAVDYDRPGLNPRFESRAGLFASTRDECLSPRVRLECNPEIPAGPGEEHWLLDNAAAAIATSVIHCLPIPLRNKSFENPYKTLC